MSSTYRTYTSGFVPGAPGNFRLTLKSADKALTQEVGILIHSEAELFLCNPPCTPGGCLRTHSRLLHMIAALDLVHVWPSRYWRIT